MANLQPSAVLVPAIALTLDVSLYFLLLYNATNKQAYRQFTLTSSALAFLLNIVWEVAQIPLFKDGAYTVNHILVCAMATVADVIMVLLIHFGFALLYRSALWFTTLTVRKIFFIMIVGGTGAVLAELRHLRLGNWAYSESMPLIPAVNVGLSPVLQFMILPPLVYYMSNQIVKKGRPSGKK